MTAATQHEQTAVATAARLREVLSFRLGPEEYGIDILRVQEIRSYERPTAIANAPAFIKGVVNLRGVIVPIVDLRIKFGNIDPEYTSTTSVVVLNVAERVVGSVVDSVSDVIALAGDQIHTPPEFNTQISAEHIDGLATLKEGNNERLLILLDIDQLMRSVDMGLFTDA